MKKHYDVKVQISKAPSRAKSTNSWYYQLFMIIPVLILGVSLMAQDCGTGETIIWDEDQTINGTFELAHEDVLQILPGVNVIFETTESMLVINGTILAEGT